MAPTAPSPHQHGQTPRPSRREVLVGGAVGIPVALLTGSVAGAAPAAAAAPRPRDEPPAGPAVRGADVSFTLQLEEAGATWSYRGREGDPIELLDRAGANWVRLRVWVDPPAGYSTAERAMRLARRAKQAGMNVLLDFHYSDFWADPGKQFTPKAWEGQDLAQLSATVYDYTRGWVERFARHGAAADMVQVGNEVVAGMLWPVGQVYREETENFADFSRLLRAGLAGVRDAHVRGRSPRTMVHIDRGGDNAGTRYFFDRLLAHDVEFDVIGQSYYPFWHGSLDDLTANLVDTASRYDKDIVVVETSYPWTLDNGDDLENLINDPAELPDRDRWPATPRGQFDYFAALRAVFPQVPGGHGLGFMAWEPQWLPGVGWAPGEGNPNDNLTLFDFDGRALPAIEAFRHGPMRWRPRQ
ncbi:MAG TPA: arabinogalactan endo-1,4-beta-galactosidase [Nocardioidaceae bacterium]|nr:arabinogalactan endo-1,4-beta-galactosidase [Nocardioidaceae bacterium]